MIPVFADGKVLQSVAQPRSAERVWREYDEWTAYYVNMQVLLSKSIYYLILCIVLWIVICSYVLLVLESDMGLGESEIQVKATRIRQEPPTMLNLTRVTIWGATKMMMKKMWRIPMERMMKVMVRGMRGMKAVVRRREIVRARGKVRVRAMMTMTRRVTSLTLITRMAISESRSQC